MMTRRPDNFDIARSAWAGVRQIWRTINTEVKAHDKALNVAPTMAGNIQNLADIPVGDTYAQRDGISVKPMNLTLRYHLTNNGSQTARQIMFRCIIFRAKYENDVDITPSDVLALISTNSVCISGKNYAKRFKTKILHDSTHLLTKDSIAKGTLGKTGTIVLKLGGHIKYDPAQADGTDLENGGVYMLCVSDTAVPGDVPNFKYVSRITYTDN